MLGAMTDEHWLHATPPERLGDPTLTLRRPTDDDAAALLDAVTTSLAELTPWMAWATPGYGEEQVRGYLELSRSSWDARREFNYAIVDADGVIAGMVGLMARLEPGGLEMGYWVRTDRTGRGLARRAAALLVDAALRMDEVTHVEIHHDEANTRSGAIPAALRFRRVEVRDHPPEAPGETGRRVVWRRVRG